MRMTSLSWAGSVGRVRAKDPGEAVQQGGPARDGREVHALCPWSAGLFHPELGQRVTVYYNAADPARFDVAEQRTSRWLLTVVPGVVGIFFLLTGLQWVVG